MDKKERKIVIVLLSIIAVSLFLAAIGITIHYTGGKSSTPTNTQNTETKPTQVEEKKYTYWCLEGDVKKDEIITKNMMKKCNSSSEIELALNDFYFGLDEFDSETYYVSSDLEADKILYDKDLYWKLKKSTEAIDYTQTGDYIQISIRNDGYLYMEYAAEMVPGSSRVKVFDKVQIKSFSIANLSRAVATHYVLLFAVNGDVYISNEEFTGFAAENDFSKFTFKKLNIANIQEFHMTNNLNEYASTNLYAIDNKGISHNVDF